MTQSKNINVGYDDDVIASEAASWIAQLDGKQMTDADRIALREWVTRSPRHRVELEKLAHLWCEFDTLTNELFEGLESPPSFTQAITAGFRVRPSRAFGFVAACACAFMLIAAISVSLPTFLGNAPYQVTYNVLEGEHKEISLPDGSSLHLNTSSLIEVVYTKEKREIRLARGEAHFTVAKDETRPFVVHAGGSMVTAVGTAFSVRLDQGDTSVIVTEGVVEFSSMTSDDASTDNASQPAGSTTLSAGQRVQLTQNANAQELTIKPISEENMKKELAWRRGLLVFEGEPLTHVIDEFSRYTTLQVVISDPEIRDIPIGGVFNAGEIQGLLGALQTSFGVEAIEIEENVIYLSKTES